MARKRRLSKLPRQQLAQRIWQGIVEFANADFASDTNAPKRLGGLVSGCLDWFGSGPNPLTTVVEEINRYVTTEKATEEDAIRFWGAQYQQELREVLTWLTAPKQHRDLGAKVMRFLQENDRGLSFDISDPNYEFDESGNDGYPIFFWPSLHRCDSIMSPICKFLIARMWQFQEHDSALSEAIPIRLCERQGCNKFKLPQRQRARCFCSDKCRARSHQEKTDWAAYMREYRKTVHKMSGVTVSRGRRRTVTRIKKKRGRNE